ncbi:NAD(P)H-dependent FMN reductase PA1204-like isoform X2 [Ylistrum balloti]|uniref:NAD(P)H-dependent FMN reductase PA1204-like isoform X2 n=1 Tax=Ylistrum balloti TaxID=509963 RepID=UPI002905D519|nr:NAD(P)H-dependent FMN reductase PA1204-like isoform X2 [Ylistrum balloti]
MASLGRIGNVMGNIDDTEKDAADNEFSMLNKPVFFYGKDREGAPPFLVEKEKLVKEADAYVIISPEYNHCIPPGLSNMIDHFGGSCFSKKPSGLVTYSAGQYGGMRAAMQLRALTGELGCLSVSNIFGIPSAQKSLDSEGNPLNEHMESGANKLLTQLDWMAWAMKNHRAVSNVDF